MALKAFFKRLLPKKQALQEHKQLSFLGEILHDPDIFHITRRSLSGGVAIGLFLAFMPFPGQTIVAAIAAIYCRVNLPVTVFCVWLTNPITIPPLFYLAYKTGALMLNLTPEPYQFELSVEWISMKFMENWAAVVLGCLTLGALAGLAGYIIMSWVWRLATIRQWQDRKQLKS